MEIEAAQEILDIITDAVVAGDAQTYLDNTMVPYLLVNNDDSLLSENGNVIAQRILKASKMYAEMNIVSVRRLVRCVIPHGPNLCIVHFDVLRKLADGTLHSPAFEGACVFRRYEDNRWRSVVTLNSQNLETKQDASMPAAYSAEDSYMSVYKNPPSTRQAKD